MFPIALNPKGQGITNVYDLRGNITNRIDAFGRTNHFRYDDSSHMLAHIDPLGSTTTYSKHAAYG